MSKLKVVGKVLKLVFCLFFFYRMVSHGDGGGNYLFQLGGWFLCRITSTAEGLDIVYSYSGLAALAAVLTVQAAWQLYRSWKKNKTSTN